MPTRGNIDFDQVRDLARQGDGESFQMFGSGTPVTDDVAGYDADGNVIPKELIAGANMAITQDATSITFDASAGGGGGGGISTYTDTYANIPDGSPIDQAEMDLFFPSDGRHMFRAGIGDVWAPWGPIYPMKIPPTAGWSWINQGTATVDDTKGGIFLRSVATTGRQFRVRTRARPSDPTSTPYTIDIVLSLMLAPRSPCNAGVGWRQSSDGKMAFALFVFDSGQNKIALNSQKCTNATTFSANYSSEAHWGAIMNPQLVFVRLLEDATNRQIWWSMDGQEWVLFHTVGRTDFLTADEVCISVDSENTVFDAGMLILSWYEH